MGFAVQSGEEGLQDDFVFGVGDLRGLDAEGAGCAEAVREGEVRAGSRRERLGGG